MTAQEFSHEFDVLYNNITNGVAPGVNEYEKSIFLTRAQLQFVQDILLGKTITGDSVDSSTMTKENLKPLYKNIEIAPSVQLPGDDILYPLNVEATISGSNKIKHVTCIPVSYNDIYNITNNPFHAKSNKAYYLYTNNNFKIYFNGLKLDNGYTLYVDYIKYPNPIITADLDSEYTIDDKHTITNSELPDSTHFEILKRAVQLALAANGVAQ